ncbi:glycosyltransferase family 4 protein [Paenibacillus dokdonensis]|uniref:glycosyltransferase family 4 protein n=1 Tax=Paenibacillus dokdonensis TaxID=2567944 RepID=UPI001FE27B50|nr:glycosyltransferase family 4 protein [Paenibacillus dokdonensis]
MDWWILGKTAKVIQRYHPDLELINAAGLDTLIQKIGSQEINRRYSIISTMCLGMAAWAIFKNIRIDSSAAVSYYYFSSNYETFREWKDPILPDPEFLRLVLPRIPVIGAMNQKLAQTLKELVPHARVEYIGHFVDTTKFSLSDANRDLSLPLVIGWAGDKVKKSKNYDSLFQPIQQYFEHQPEVKIVETSGEYAYDDMPLFYHSIDLLLITSANEGGCAPALEAYACGKPVLSTHVGYVKEAAPTDAYPLILDSDDPIDFIQTIQDWMHRRNGLEAVGQRCREEVEAHWGIDQAVNHWLKVLFNR